MSHRNIFLSNQSCLNAQSAINFYGEPQAEFNTYYDYTVDGLDYENEDRFNMLRTLGITAEDMHGMIDTPEDPVDKRDLIPYTFPDSKELEKLNYQPVSLGSFIPWDHHKNTELIKRTRMESR